ncbi:hypothetical protein ABZ471_10995 [Streptomyces sp. NPDC005728]|uniref:hypothetical protein n=1 Tax=Streptomyces sp. NPDC005728 TaxID=3157054 RepID=UPI0033C5316A
MRWWSSLITIGRDGLRIQRAFAAPPAIARAVLAVLLATVLGRLLDDPVAGSMAGVGAFICGIGTLLSPLRHPVVNALGMAAAFGTMAVLGALVHGTTWLFLLLLAVSAFAAGLWWTLGVAPGIRGCLAVIGLMITADLAPDVHGGLVMAGWIAVGTGLVVVVQLLPPYGPRFAAQRRALAALYQSLAEASLAAGSPALGRSAPFTAARQALELLPQFSRPAAAAMFGLLGEAERVRRALQTVRTTAPATAAAGGQESLAAAQVLGDISRTVAAGRLHRTPEEVWNLLESWAAASPVRSPRDLAARLRLAEQLAGRSTEDRVGDVLEPHTEVPGPAAWARAADTVVGAALAVLVFLVWPTWSTRRLPGLLAEWLRVQDRLLPELLTGYADVGATDLGAIDELRARSRQVREHLEAAVEQSHAEPAEHRGPWSSAQLEQIRTQVSTVAGRATLLREHLPQAPQDTVPELTELADPLHEHLAALARAASGAETVAPGALRSVFDSFTARSGLLAETYDGSGNAATSRAVALSTATVDAVEALTVTIASRHRHRRHAAA